MEAGDWPPLKGQGEASLCLNIETGSTKCGKIQTLFLLSHTAFQHITKRGQRAPAWSSALESLDLRQLPSHSAGASETLSPSPPSFPHWSVVHFLTFDPSGILPVRSPPALSAARDPEGSFGPSLISRVSLRSTRFETLGKNRGETKVSGASANAWREFFLTPDDGCEKTAGGRTGGLVGRMVRGRRRRRKIYIDRREGDTGACRGAGEVT